MLAKRARMSLPQFEEKQFAIKHIFNDILNLKEHETIDGPIEYHYNIPWKIRISREIQFLKIYLECMITADRTDWYIDTATIGKTIRTLDEIQNPSYTFRFDKNRKSTYHAVINFMEPKKFVCNGNFTFEFSVVIENAFGLNMVGKLRRFDNDAAKEDSDVTLVVGNEKFHLNKKYLAGHSTYFKSLFSGNFSESEKSEIELKDIDPDEFQHFLELIYGESLVEDFSVLGILHLADFFDSKSAIRRCEEFLIYQSELPVKERFHAAVKYKLEKLKEKCVSELKSHADFLSIVPEDPAQFDVATWKELFVKSNSFHK